MVAPLLALKLKIYDSFAKCEVGVEISQNIIIILVAIYEISAANSLDIRNEFNEKLFSIKDLHWNITHTPPTDASDDMYGRLEGEIDL